MNRKQLIFLLMILAIVGGAGLILLNRGKESWAAPGAKMGDKVLPNFRYNDVAAIRIRGGSDLNVVRKDDNWRVQERGDYPANFHQISDLLIKMKDLKVVEAETVGSSDLSRVELDEPGKGPGSGTLVEFKDGQGKVLQTVLLGKKHILESSPSPFKRGSPDGRYLLLPDNPAEVLLISDALGSFDPNPQQWLSKDFFKVERAKSVSLTSTNPANSWKLSRESESSPWNLVDGKAGEVLDTNKASSTGDSLSFPSFVDVALNTAPTQTGLDNPTVVTVETFDHFTYTLKIGAKAGEESCYFAVAVTAEIPTGRAVGNDEKPEDKQRMDKEFQDQTRKLQAKLKQEQALAPWVYVVNSWILEPVIRDRGQLLVGRKAGNAPDAEKSAKSDPPSVSTEIAPILLK
jgi:hypothetical protein